MDDSTNIMGFKDINKISDYLDNYYELLDIFYTTNMLKINPDKTKFLIICNKKLRNICKNITFKAGE